MAKQVRYIPEGQHTVTPHLTVKGGAQAIDFYKKAFGATEMHRMTMPGKQEIMHAMLKLGDSFVYLNDEMHTAKSPASLGGSPVTIHLYVEDVDAVFKKAVAAGAKETMPPMDMFWGDRYAKVTDPFGHEWSIATHKEDVPPQEMGKRAQEAMAKMGKQCG
jgi:PhnB protein